MSADGQNALTIIAFIGSVFSPYYAFARRLKKGDPLNHCALNVALYGTAGKYWALTERTRHDLERDEARLTIGPSAMTWDGTTLTIDINERTVPFPSRIEGTVRVRPITFSNEVTSLDTNGQHTWLPIAPRALVEVELNQPLLKWTGEGYLDSNSGAEPLEKAFKSWNWSRAQTADGTLVLYDVERRDGTQLALARLIDKQGIAHPVEARCSVPLPKTIVWRIPRETRADAIGHAQLIKTLEDTPFYSRSLIKTQVCGSPVTAVHESLCLDRFTRPYVQAMLPFRMPRKRLRKPREN